MHKVSKRAVIQYLLKKGMSGQDIHKDMIETLGEDAPSYSTVKKWVAEFKRGNPSVQDAPRSGRPATACTEENITAIQDLVMSDRRVTERFIADKVGISLERVGHILTVVLDMHKVSSRWVPRMLTVENKRERHVMSAANLTLLEADPVKFLERFVTMDEAWVHHFQPESKVQSKQWKHPSSPTPKKFKSVPSAGKVMVSVFWDSRGVILAEYLKKGETVNGAYYAAQLKRLREAIKAKRPGMLKKRVLFHQDNAPVHKSTIAMSAIESCGFELLTHPPYSPDLAPSDFHLFPKLKQHLAGTHFPSDDDVMAAVERYFDTQDETFYKDGIMGLQHRWQKCVALKGDYVEK